MYSECWAGPIDSEAIFDEISVAASRKRNGLTGIFQWRVPHGRGRPRHTPATFRPIEKTSPRTLPQAWSQLLPPRREATKLFHLLDLRSAPSRALRKSSHGTH